MQLNYRIMEAEAIHRIPLLKNLRTQTYLLSTNGKGQKVPNKAMIAHLPKNAEERGYNCCATMTGGELHIMGIFYR